MTAITEADVELAQIGFYVWWGKHDSTLGEGQEYEEVAARVKQVASLLHSENMTLYHQSFRVGFSFYYGETSNTEKLIPISRAEGRLLSWQTEETGESWWPIKNPATNTYFTPKVKIVELPSPSENVPTEEYLESLANKAAANKQSREHRILEALTPYSQQIEGACCAPLYAKI